MFASKLITERRGRKSPMMWFLSLSAVLILLAADTLFAQTYQFSLQVRRLGDQVACEVWVKSLVPNAPKLGNFSYSINYKSDYLDPADPDNYPYYETDSVDMDVNQRPNPDNPFRVITSPYHSNNGYTAINMSPGADYLDASGYGWSSFQVAFNGDSITQGIKPATTGRGTFVAKFVFDIVDHSFNDTCTMGIGNHSRPYPSYDIHDIYSNTYSQGTGFTLIDPPVMKIRGISILNPRGPYEEVDRDAHYLSLPVGGYPVYFERSGLINTDSYSYGTPYVAYEVTYSVDEGSSWSNVMRFAETIDSIRAAQYDNFASGELETRYGGVPGYVVTQGNGDPLTAGGDGYGGVLRIIWADDSNFTGRSEKARIKFQQLSLTGVGSDIDLRSRLSISDSSAYNFDISRFFFTQLNGTNEYFKTASNYSNSTQLTVEAWVNLNTSVTYSAGDEPGIVASSGGPSSPGHGAWLLYLKDGRYPAFRAREIKDRGRNGGVFIDTIVSPDPLTAVNSAFLLTLDAASEVHRKNWTHIAATVNKDTLTLFVNGKIVAQKTNRTYNDIRMATFEHPIWIGVNPDISLDASDYLNAGIKEVKVWRKALNFEQIMQHAAGVYDPIGTITQISNIEGSTDLRRVLDIYYSFEANKFDIAGDQVAQGSEMGLDFYKADIADNPSISYRPDRAHIKLVTPIAGEGICNLEDVTYAIRWIGFGVGTVNPNSVDVNIEFSRDENKVFWELATDNTITPSGLYLDTVDMESAKAIWEPFNNVTEDGAYHDLQGVGNTIAENYTKQVYLKISGTSSHSQPDINDISDPFYVAPHFALRNLGEGSVYIPDNSDMNLSTGVSFIEAWINPYRFPTDDEEFFPIICKVDSVEGISHYSFRLLNTGRLQFVVVKADGSGDTVYSDATRPLVRPNETILDSVWTHVGVFLNLANGTGQSSIRFYIDGVPQTADSITTSLGSAVNLNFTNTYPVFLGYEPGPGDPDLSRTFVGAIKEVRFWNGYPAGKAISGIESTSNPTDLTKFIQGAQAVRAEDLLTTPTNYKQNLVAAFSFNGGGYLSNGRERALPSTNSKLTAYINGPIGLDGDGVSFIATKPFIKLVEPIFKQIVPNSTTDLRVRWVGFDYDEVNFNVGDAADSSDLEFGVEGGGGLDNEPYQAVASTNNALAYTDAMSLESDSKFRFPGVATPRQYAAKLNVSIGDPDVNNDSVYTDQGPIPPALTNARLRYRGRATINSTNPYEYIDINSLISEGPLYSITPPSNFTVRVLPEGFHSGSDEEVNNIGETLEALGIKISLFDEVAGKPGTKVDSAVSITGYETATSARDATADPVRGTAGSRFANVPFVFTELYDGSYYVVVEHLNHLPVMSKYTAPFMFSGDNLSTWNIESGWDFQSWGQNSTPSSSDVMSVSTDDIYSGNGLFSAFGTHEISKVLVDYATTGLIFNQGRETDNTNRMAAMVAGDVVRDGQINASDRILVREDAGSNVHRSDVTGEGNVNGQDRDIVDRNGNKISSLMDLTVVQYSASGKKEPTPVFAYMSHENPLEHVSPLNPEFSIVLNKAAKDFIENGSIQEAVVAENDKKHNRTLGGLNYKVIAEPFMKDDHIEITLYLQNVGDEWAPGNCTFAISYDQNLLQFENLTNTIENPFRDNEVKGYYSPYSAPQAYAPDPVADARTIEIDYDGFLRKMGINVPYTRTKLGTLSFKIKQVSDEYSFGWHKLSVVLTTLGTDITKYGEFEEIEPINVTRSVLVTVPNGGESWRAGRLYTISWTKPSISAPAYLEFSTDKGASWTRISNNAVDIVTQNYDWKTPRIRSTECLVRLINSQTGSVIDQSDAPFTLQPSPAEIVRPAAADPVYVGGQKDFIRWLVDDPAKVRFEFSEDGGLSSWVKVTPITNSENTEIDWVLPAVNTKRGVVRMVNNETGEVMAISEDFKVLAGAVTITSPRAGDEVKVGENRTIRWTFNNVSKFDMQYSIDGGATWQELKRDVTAYKGSERWVIPDVGTTDKAMIRALYNNDPDMEYSRTSFSIVGGTSVKSHEDQMFSFERPAPNPFSGLTTLQFTLPFTENVTITVFNNIGMKVAVPVASVDYSAGTHTLMFNGYDLPAGVYYININAGAFNMTREIVKMK